MPIFLLCENGDLLTTEDGTFLILEQLVPGGNSPGCLLKPFGLFDL